MTDDRSMTPDAYDSVARHYDLQGWDWYAATYGQRLLELVRERGFGEGSLLDAGCGTGTLALALARTGIEVAGVDLSPSLLDVAREKDADGAVAWHHGDITRLDLGRTFDVVTCVADTLNHLPTLDDWRRAFEGFARHLEPGGMLFFDVMTAYGLERMDSYFVRERPEQTLITGIVWEPTSRRSTMKVTSFLRGDDGRYDRASSTITEWARSVDAIRDALAEAGFRGIELPFAVGDEPEGEERLAVVATRG